MADHYIQGLFADRIGGDQFGKDTTIYKFEKIKRAKLAAIEAHPNIEIFDYGVGEPDDMAFPMVVEALKIECGKSENRPYADNGIKELKVAAAEYIKNVFGVDGINPDTEVVHSIGSKSALAMFPDIFINKGDVILMTTPGYPVMATHTEWHGGKVVDLPLEEKNNFLPDLDAIKESDLKKAKLLYLNYPNNPTGAVATKEFFEKVVKFAKKNELIVVHDAAYAALTFDKPLSFLSVPGAKEVGVEMHSFSKAFNMTGWRLAFLVGGEKIINAFAHVKDNYDSGQFIAIQKAGVYALEHPEITEKISAKYKRRLELLVTALNDAGFNATMPAGSFYLYTNAPVGAKGGVTFDSGEAASQYLIKEAQISTVPWDNCGAFLRFSATFAASGEEEERKVIKETGERLKELDLVF